MTPPRRSDDRRGGAPPTATGTAPPLALDSVELGEEPRAALERKVREELDVAATQSGTLEPTATPFSRTFTSMVISSDA